MTSEASLSTEPNTGVEDATQTKSHEDTPENFEKVTRTYTHINVRNIRSKLISCVHASHTSSHTNSHTRFAYKFLSQFYTHIYFVCVLIRLVLNRNTKKSYEIGDIHDNY